MSCGPKLLHEWTIAGYIVRIEETEPGIVRFVQGRCDASLPPSIMEFEPTEKPIGTANEIIHLAKALEQQREATKEAWRAAALRAWYDCIDCGSHIKVDEDGCCATCGRDAKFVDTGAIEARLREHQRALLWCYGWLNEAMWMKRPTPERIAGVIEDDKWNKVGALVGEASDEVDP